MGGKQRRSSKRKEEEKGKDGRTESERIGESVSSSTSDRSRWVVDRPLRAEAKMAKGIRQVNTISDGNKDKQCQPVRGK
jgi:hypothetical protein